MATVIVEHDRGVTTITLDSPANRNALSAALVADLGAALAAAGADDAVRAVALTHTGSTFCAGNDLREASAEGGPQRSTARLVTLLRSIVELPKPVIARVDGHVRAGGLGLIGACDLVLAGATSTFAFTEVRLGLVPAVISLTTLSRMPERGAARYLLTGEVFDAVVAQQLGVVTECRADLDAALAQLLDSLRGCSPQGLVETKRLITAPMRAAFDAHGTEVQQLSARLFASAEGREGLQAFIDKRPPSWVRPA